MIFDVFYLIKFDFIKTNGPKILNRISILVVLKWSNLFLPISHTNLFSSCNYESIKMNVLAYKIKINKKWNGFLFKQYFSKSLQKNIIFSATREEDTNFSLVSLRHEA